MLYYERVQQPRLGIYPIRNSPRSSEETLKPDTLTVHVNGSESSLASTSELGVLHQSEEKKLDRVMGPRVVRSVAAGRGRSLSAAPSSERESSVMSSAEKERTPKLSETSLPNGIGNGVAYATPSSSHQKSPTPELPLPALVGSSASEPASSTPPPISPPPSEPPPPRIHSPRPVHPPVEPALVGLRA
jgi:ubiquitin carboxyl-terminal hydrolase 1